MAKKFLVVLVASLAVGMIFSSGAFAHNRHQAHRGACARSTLSISKGVSDLQYNRVLGKFARAFGLHGYDGSLSYQMENRLVVGSVAYAVDTNNHGCTGSGGVFGVGKRHLYRGEHVIVEAPARYGKDACVHPSRQCSRVRIVVHVALPVSCWNLNTGRMVIYIWVRKHPKPHKPVPTPKAPVQAPAQVVTCPAGTVVASNGNCVAQSNTSTQTCGNGQVWSVTGCVTIQINANCGNVAVGSGTVTQGGNCNQSPPGPCGCTPPPPPPPPPPAPSVSISIENINDVPAAQCRPVTITESGTEAGSLQISPLYGAIGNVDCYTPSSEQSSLTIPVSAGNNAITVYVWAPADASATSDTLTVVPTGMAGIDPKSNSVSETYQVSHSTRP